ncbi:unnamed protein product [Didymodactylos carnosus]|uniref:ASCH domain-containing protein n=1 Tax=Didymodactylos carnosus TaxID=1234261 RepID=A0A8S2EB68_9BILA|nr:unnamed protein product [Didymodactylos carnosus]CAF3863830.1 unnamed protein product [Didymodactylos carnosus]
MNRKWREQDQQTSNILDDQEFSLNDIAKAVAHKNKLIEFDRTRYNEARSVQENAHYKLKADREMEEQQQLELLKMIDWEEHEILNRNLPGNFTAPQWVEKNPKTVSVCSNVSVEDRDRQRLRIQDKDLMEMYDDGQCLTMHQPWASLLVRGIKMHEGRTWHTAHRGRLWIHAAAKEPDTQTIYDMETFYRQRENGDQIDFPSEYPTSMLLGCVELVDCLERDTYTEKFPKGESDSDYVFICENPQELFFKLPMKGQHKIFKLDPQVHQTAKKVLLRRTANTA